MGEGTARMSNMGDASGTLTTGVAGTPGSWSTEAGYRTEDQGGSPSAAELRREIDQTRDHMSDTLDAIGDRVMPGRIIQRRRNRMRSSVDSVRSTLMGAPSQAHASLSDTRHSAAAEVGELSHAVQQRTEGNPFAVGLLAFGAGMLAATLLPTTQREQNAVAQAKDKAKDMAGPLSETVHEAASELMDSVKGHGQEAVAAVKQSGSEAAADVRDHAAERAAEVKDHAPTPRS